MPYLRVFLILIAFSAAVSDSIRLISPAAAQQAATATTDTAADPAADAENVDVAEKVEINPSNDDPQIANRLEEIFEATGWFRPLAIEVDRGVVFISGQTDSEKHLRWAEATAMRTTDVVAVVNRLTVAERPVWDFTPAWQSTKQLGREAVAMVPFLLVAAAVILVTYFTSKFAGRLARRIASRRIDSRLLMQVIGNVTAVFIFIIGFYIALRVSGLTRLAVTLLGGTGLVGLALGFAFRDIAENYLSSILISLNHPFRVGDLIEVEGSKGFVRKVTTRGTILNTLEGNQIQIPNSTVYKSQILNFTATPLLRLSFGVGIGFDDPVTQAQSILMRVFEDHRAVKHDPAPLVLVDSLGAATVNLVCHYWIDQHTHSPLKVGSSIVRLAKEALASQGISMPDEARELVFPHGVPVELIQADPSRAGLVRKRDSEEKQLDDPAKREAEVSAGEGDLSNEQTEVLRITEDDQVIAGETNLID